jgi:hypothetical protein
MANKKAKWNDNLMFIQMGEHKIPEFKTIRNEDWIGYGGDNNYPDDLIELWEGSATHGAIVNGKADYVLGEGWEAGGATSIEMKAKINSFISSINGTQSLDELSEPVLLDFELYDGLYLEVILNKAKTDFTLEYLPFNKMRTNKEIDTFWFSNDWKARKQSEEKTGLREYKAFDPEKWRQGESSTVFYYKLLKPRKGNDPNVYPLPTYIGGTKSIETEIECTNFNLVEIKTGFKAGTMINFYNGEPDPDAKKVLKKKIEAMYSGTDKAGSFVLNFSDGKDRGSDIVALNGNDMPERYGNVKKDSSKDIFTAHRVSSPSLFGVQQDGATFGTAQEIAEQYELFQNTYISPRQQKIEGIFNGFASLKGIPAKLRLKPTKAITPNLFTEQTIVNALPRAAVRDLVAEHVGIDLKKYEDKPVVTTTETVDTEMAKEVSEDLIIEEFSRIGRDRDLFEVIDSKPFTFTSEIDTVESELQIFRDEPQNDEDKIDSKELRVLQIPKITKAEEKDIKINKIEILYSYEERHNAPRLKGQSRNFCKTLIDLNRLYKRKEIDGLSNGMNTNVWLYKGGWYSNPNTEAPTPQCRHIWRQNIVRLK